MYDNCAGSLASRIQPNCLLRLVQRNLDNQCGAGRQCNESCFLQVHEMLRRGIPQVLGSWQGKPIKTRLPNYPFL